MIGWEAYIKGFKFFLQLEKSLSENSVEAYIRDVQTLSSFLNHVHPELALKDISQNHLRQFIENIHSIGMSVASQARIISGIRSFFKYLLLEDEITHNPSELLESPKALRKLPDTLSIEELEKLLLQIDLSTPEGTRNRAILETMYSCGLRVSEVIQLKISNIYPDVGFIRVIGKGNKEKDWYQSAKLP